MLDLVSKFLDKYAFKIEPNREKVRGEVITKSVRVYSTERRKDWKDRIVLPWDEPYPPKIVTFTPLTELK